MRSSRERLKLVLTVSAVIMALLTILVFLNTVGVVRTPVIGKLLDLIGVRTVKEPKETGEPQSVEELLAEMGHITEKRALKETVVITEAEAYRAFAERGFTEQPITTSYDEHGAYMEEKEISKEGTGTHPCYMSVYQTDSKAYWVVILMGDSFYAEPVSYNAENTWDVPRTLSENGVIRNYDGDTQFFYALAPDPSALVIKRVDRIDAATLEEMDPDAIGKP